MTGPMADINPIRYRGYYADNIFGWYWLQTRWYVPQWGRFLNADVLFIAGNPLTAANMYAYCDGNPVMFVDPSGMAPELHGMQRLTEMLKALFRILAVGDTLLYSLFGQHIFTDDGEINDWGFGALAGFFDVMGRAVGRMFKLSNDIQDYNTNANSFFSLTNLLAGAVTTVKQFIDFIEPFSNGLMTFTNMTKGITNFLKEKNFLDALAYGSEYAIGGLAGLAGGSLFTGEPITTGLLYAAAAVPFVFGMIVYYVRR